MVKGALFLILFLGSYPAHAQRAQAELACAYSGTGLAYDCTILLSRVGKPLAGATLTVGADMPSMPMAHHVKPVRANPGARPGEYRVRLDLPMDGEWAVKLRLAAPLNEQIVLHTRFDAEGAHPAQPRSRR